MPCDTMTFFTCTVALVDPLFFYQQINTFHEVNNMKQPGYIVLDLSPGPENPRNSEGAFFTLPDGRILFSYSKFIGASGSDDGYACIAMRMSTDQGETWSDDQILFRTEDHNAKNIMSVSFLAMNNGDIGLFYAVRKGWHDTRLHLRRSTDLGQTWGDAIPCIPSLGYYVTNNDRVIRLRSGRILVPANLHRMKGLDTQDWSNFDSRGIPCLFYSDDDGVTWHEGKGYCQTTLPHSRSGLQESGLLELKNRVVWQWMRTDMGRQYEAYSFDGGDTWIPPVPSQFTAPTSPLSIKRMSADDRLLAVWNPIPLYNGRSRSNAGWGRTPLVMASSYNDGKTWTEPVIIENDPEHGYCYVAIHFQQDFVLLSYCAGGPADGSCLAKSVIRKIPLSELP